MTQKRESIAHLRRDACGVLIEHDLHDHLKRVAEIAAAFAREFGNSDWAFAAGILHDLGKYNPEWHEYLRKSNGDSEEGLDGQD